MSASPQAIRVLFLETTSSLSTRLSNVFHVKSMRYFFDLIPVSTVAEAIGEIDKNPPDALFLDVDPDEDPGLVALTRLHEHLPHLTIVAVLPDKYRTRAADFLRRGAHACLFEHQVSVEAMPSFLFRLIERQSIQNAMRESGERFRLMIENASDLIFIIDDGGVIDYASPSAERLFNRANSTVIGSNVLDLVHRDERKRVFEYLEDAFQTETPLPFLQFRVRDADNHWSHMEGTARIAAQSDGRRACIMNCRDVSHRMKLEEELRSLSLRDELTGLPNRRAFMTHLEQSIKTILRADNKEAYLLFIDLDGFKAINDTLGHKEGDRVLIQAASVLRATFRDADLVARLGGDEFVVFLADNLNGTQGLQVEGLKRRLSDSVEAWNRAKKRPYQLAMSVGAVQYDRHKHRSVEQLLRGADELMYKQKREKKRLEKVAAAWTENQQLVAADVAPDPESNRN
jgi:diguanylate cyclase (GGDEF)-like protein/PAS domain S-box-containing protein